MSSGQAGAARARVSVANAVPLLPLLPDPWLLMQAPHTTPRITCTPHDAARLHCTALHCSAYADPSQLSPQLLAAWTAHLAAPGTRDVLLDVITNSSGPLPQDLLPQNTVVRAL